MQLLIKQRVFSWTDTYDVYDDNGEPKYFVKAEFFSLGHRLRVFDQQRREIALVRERLLTLLPRFEIEIDGREIGSIQKKFTLFRPQYEVDYKGWRVEGDFLGWQYDVCEGCSAVARISKQLLRWGDTYVIDIASQADELAALLLVIAIDAANCSDGKD